MITKCPTDTNADMATRRYVQRTRTRLLAATIGRYGLVATATGVETLALVVWLAFVEDAALFSRAAVAGVAVLALGLLLTHYLLDLAVNGIDGASLGLTDAAVSASGTALWVAWLAAVAWVGSLAGLLGAGVLLAVLLVSQHTVADSAFRGRALPSNVADLRTLGFSVVQAGGATLWLCSARWSDLVAPFLAELGLSAIEPAVAGVGALAAALLVEHVCAVAFARR
ncbi:hypothetical protein [Halostella salina]|uniref:hypothetical protein n=1 Tax=Halostella salina TaxID=1547897 RepID=UPI000EF84166|nr:hypothetical protein [Halostella salina]